MSDLEQRHASRIQGRLSCFDRVVIMGTLPAICHSQALERTLWSQEIRFFDYPRWAEPLRDEVRLNAERITEESGLTIEFIRKRNFRKEERVKELISKRGAHPGLVHVFSAMEVCPSFKAWTDKKTGRTSLRPVDAKCLHYYFYFIHEELGLCYLRVPTWAPFRLQCYFNGHNVLANRLRREGISFRLIDNAFVEVADMERAQKLAADWDIGRLHAILDEEARRYCPVVERFSSGYHWSLMQIEYATDLMWRRAADLRPVYDVLSRTAIHAVKADNVATFLGRPLPAEFQGEVGNDFHTRVEGTRIKHHLGPASLKMYDKMGSVLRIETTVNDVTFFKHYRQVEHRDGTSTFKNAPVKKSIYSLPALAELMEAANRRYLEFLSSCEDPSAGFKHLDKLSRPAQEGKRTYRGFNLFKATDLRIFEVIARGEFTISGLKNRFLQKLLPELNPGQISRVIKRLRTHGLLRKVGNTYKYYLTKLGKITILAALKLRRFTLIPELAVVG
jgi:hypothetical protein